MIIKRNAELQRIKRLGNWIYIAGRRKTGKTFFVKNFLEYDRYFFVRKDRMVFDENGKSFSYETFFEIFKELLGKKKIVIDEFHRLPEEFFEYLHFIGEKGELITISSTLYLTKKLLGKGSPIMGLFSLMIFGLCDERDVINSLIEYGISSPKEVIEATIYLREPILALKYSSPLREFLAAYLFENRAAISEIIGEIFSEEERRLSEIYEGILRAVASGKNTSGEITSFLFSRKLIPKDNPGLIQRYLDVLVKIGILEKIEVWNKRKFRYFHVSPLFDLHYYLDEKYAYVERDIPFEWIRECVNIKLPLHIEQLFRNLFSKMTGYQFKKIEEPEIDIALFRFKKLKLIGEVKWKKKISQNELKELQKKFAKFGNVKKILIVPEKNEIENKVKFAQVIDAKDIVRIVKSQTFEF